MSPSTPLISVSTGCANAAAQASEAAAVPTTRHEKETAIDRL
jgi:hypothetical protein